MTIRIGKFIYYAAWLNKKKCQVWLRSHMSHVLALLLAALTIYREWDHLNLMFQDVRKYWPDITQIIRSGHFGLIGILVIIIVLATIAAAVWELWGNKLTTSPQEIRFVTAMRGLLQELEKFIYGKDREPDPTVRLEQFIGGFLEVTRTTLCGTKRVDGGLMLEDASGDNIVLFQSSKKAKYPKELVIPISDPQEPGPAGLAYIRQTLVYMPKKQNKLGWPFNFDEDAYVPSEPSPGWVSVEPDYEHFRSVLCLPVAIYKERNQRTKRDLKTPFGVLNYSTNSRDPFVDRDFVMGECFSSILALALATYRSEYGERARTESERPSAPSHESGTEETPPSNDQQSESA